MKKTRYTEEQIAFALETGRNRHSGGGSLQKDGHF